MSNVEIGKRWASAASAKIAIFAMMLALLGLFTGRGFDGKITAVIVAATIYMVVVGAAFVLGLMFSPATEEPPSSAGRSFGRKHAGDAPKALLTAPPKLRTRLPLPHGEDAITVALVAAYIMTQVGPLAWERAHGNLLAVPYYALLIPIEGLENIFGLT